MCMMVIKPKEMFNNLMRDFNNLLGKKVKKSKHAQTKDFWKNFFFFGEEFLEET